MSDSKGMPIIPPMAPPARAKSSSLSPHSGWPRMMCAKPDAPPMSSTEPAMILKAMSAGSAIGSVAACSVLACLLGSRMSETPKATKEGGSRKRKMPSDAPRPVSIQRPSVPAKLP